MSDPVTNAEVEDVLSSIRRLVSEDKRPARQETTKAVSDRLVLTPALRVAEDVPPVEEQPPAEPAQEAAERHDEGAAPFTATDFDEDDDSWEQPSATVHEMRVDAVTAKQDDDEAWPDDRSEGALAGSDDPDWTVPDHDRDALNDDGHQNPGPAESAALDAGGHSQAAEAASDPAPDEGSADAAHDASDDDGDTDGSQALSAEGDDRQSDAAATLSAKIAALETAIGRIPGEWEPDDTGTDDYSGTDAPTLDWEDHLEFDAKGAPVRRAVPTAAQDAARDDATTDTPPPQQAEALDSGLAADEQLIDEEALRDLVGEIVRSELQGALGERITRNVRKLVRREIHRALAAQELD